MGAKAFANAADAVRGAARVHLVLSDDHVVDSVIEGASSFLGNPNSIDSISTLVNDERCSRPAWPGPGRGHRRSLHGVAGADCGALRPSALTRLHLHLCPCFHGP